MTPAAIYNREIAMRLALFLPAHPSQMVAPPISYQYSQHMAVAAALLGVGGSETYLFVDIKKVGGWGEIPGDNVHEAQSWITVA